MIPSLDTSALVKLYVEESGTAAVVDRVGRAALARHRREGGLSAAALELRRAGAHVEFSSFDARLNGAARREKLRVPAAASLPTSAAPAPPPKSA